MSNLKLVTESIQDLPICFLTHISASHCAAVCSFQPVTSFLWYSLWFYNNSVSSSVGKSGFLRPCVIFTPPSEEIKHQGGKRWFSLHSSILSLLTPAGVSIYTVREIKGSMDQRLLLGVSPGRSQTFSFWSRQSSSSSCALLLLKSGSYNLQGPSAENKEQEEEGKKQTRITANTQPCIPVDSIS